MTVNLAGGNILLKDHTSGIWRTSMYTPIDNGADYNGLPPDVFVSSTGSNSGSGSTEGTAWATRAYAWANAPSGSVIGVVDDLVDDTVISAMENNPGVSLANHTITVGKTIFTTITGAILPGSESNPCYHESRWLYYKGAGSARHDIAGDYLKFIGCFFSVPNGLIQGNNPMLDQGNNQLYESCGFMGDSGRYVTLAYQRSNVLMRWCVSRSEQNVWSVDAGTDPTGSNQIYSSNDCAVVQCVNADSLEQLVSNERLGSFVNTLNQGASTGIDYIETIVKNEAYASYTCEGGSSSDAHYQDVISIGSLLGLTTNGNSVNATVDGGQFLGAVNDGLAAYNGSLTVSNANSFGNGENYQGVSQGSGNTSVASDPGIFIPGMKRIGISGTYRGEAGWNVKQTSTPLFPLPYEADMRSIFAAYSNRGFCAAGKTLSGYLAESV